MQTTAAIMTQYLQDLVYTLTNCMSCFPGSPLLKINSRSFKILRLLGEVFAFIFPLFRDLRADISAGWLLIRILGPRHQQRSTLRAQEDPMSLWPGICRAGHEGSRGLRALHPQSQYHSQRRLQCVCRSFRSGCEDCLHTSSLLPPRKPTRHNQCESSKSH